MTRIHVSIVIALAVMLLLVAGGFLYALSRKNNPPLSTPLTSARNDQVENESSHSDDTLTSTEPTQEEDPSFVLLVLNLSLDK